MQLKTFELFIGRKTQVVDEKGIPYVTEKSSMDFYSVPSAFTAFKALFFIGRVTAGMWSGISDCDETFNYWEPAHFMLYGNGLQTWEYQVPLSLDEDLSSSPINFQPTYALRSYLYILAHAVPGWIYSRLLQPNPMLVFYFLRCMFGFLSALCEVLCQ